MYIPVFDLQLELTSRIDSAIYTSRSPLFRPDIRLKIIAPFALFTRTAPQAPTPGGSKNCFSRYALLYAVIPLWSEKGRLLQNLHRFYYEYNNLIAHPAQPTRSAITHNLS